MKIISIDEFLNTYDNKNTARAYKNIFKLYLNHIMENKETEKINELSIEYIQKLKKEKAIEDIKSFINYMNRENIAPLTMRNRYALIFLWLDINEIKLSRWDIRKIKQNVPAPKVQTIEQELNTDILFKIYNELNLREQAMFLLMAGSGTRLNETSLLQVKDLDLENKIIYINRNYTKNKSDRIIMITEEAKEKIQELIAEKNIDSGRIFETTKTNFYNSWYKALNRIDYNKKSSTTKTKRYMIHPHMLRKWFLSQFKLYASGEIAELLAGHEGYLTNAYRRYSIDEIKREYEKAEMALSITKNNNVSIKMNNKNNTLYGVCYEC